jgi:hypothetical protein
MSIYEMLAARIIGMDARPRFFFFRLGEGA